MTDSRSENRILKRDEFDSCYDQYVLNSGFLEEGNYYEIERQRYWLSLNYFAQLDIPRPAKILEIGGGQLAILCHKIFQDQSVVGDISEKYRLPIDAAGVGFRIFNLLEEQAPEPQEQFDAIILLEVIEHMPIPAYIILERIRAWLKPGGVLFLTTPNLFRFRNLVRMAMGKDFTDMFMYPEPNSGLGHQLEYSAAHLVRHFDRSGFELILNKYDQLGEKGHSPKARLARLLLKPLELRPKWREKLVMAARN